MQLHYGSSAPVWHSRKTIPACNPCFVWSLPPLVLIAIGEVAAVMFHWFLIPSYFQNVQKYDFTRALVPDHLREAVFMKTDKVKAMNI